MDQAWSSVAAMEAAITDGTAMQEYEDTAAADGSAPRDDAYVPPEMPHVGPVASAGAVAAVVAADAAMATSAAPAAAGGETGGAAPVAEQEPVAPPRAQPMIAVETLATLPEVVKLAPGYRIEDGTKFPWWFTANAHNSEAGAEPAATVDRILMYPLVEGPDYDVGWYARYFYTFGTSRPRQPP